MTQPPVVICTPERAGTYAMWCIVRELQRARGDWIEYRAPRSWDGLGGTVPDMDSQARFGAMPSGQVVEVDGGGPHARASWDDVSRAASCWWTHSPLEWVLDAVTGLAPIIVLRRDLEGWAASYEAWSGLPAPTGRWELFEASFAAAMSDEVDVGAAGVLAFDCWQMASDEALPGVVSWVRHMLYGDDVSVDDECLAVAAVCSKPALRAEAPAHVLS